MLHSVYIQSNRYKQEVPCIRFALYCIFSDVFQDCRYGRTAMQSKQPSSRDGSVMLCLGITRVMLPKIGLLRVTNDVDGLSR